MLKAMRKHAKFFYVLFFIVILSFIFWGVGTVDKQTGVPVAEVGKDRITSDEYWTSYERARDFYRNIMKENFTEEAEKKLNLKRQVLDSMVDERVLMAEAKKMGITVSDAEVEEAIINDPSFLRDGKFSKDVYLRILQLNRLSPEFFEYSKRRDLTVAKMRRLIEESVDVADADLTQKAEGQAQDSLRQAILGQMKSAAIKSYIDGIKKQMKIKINEQLLS
ncbi:MAG TPA: SurA N-terminal domain-containing protein [Thermodesulfovibrionales bacterium]|nr:SurA N-terminal domain-containing protein [Thermodesulfovibrionales bacterium]